MLSRAILPLWPIPLRVTSLRGVALWLSVVGSAAAQNAEQPDRSLQFAWPDTATIQVTSENWRTEDGRDRSFVLGYRVVVSREPDGRLRVGRRDVTVTKWNGEDVPDAARSQLAPIELQTELLPDLMIDAQGRCQRVEAGVEFRKRAEARLADRVKDGTLDRAAAQRIAASLLDPSAHKSLAVQAKKPWDEWIARYRDLDFSEEELAEFVGETELATGDVVDGKFSARHFGPMQDREGHVRLRIDFEAKGPRLDAAALKWRQRLLGGGDEAFEKVALAVRERNETALRPDTMQPAWAETERTTTVTVGDEAKEIRERRRWTFEW